MKNIFLKFLMHLKKIMKVAWTNQFMNLIIISFMVANVGIMNYLTTILACMPCTIWAMNAQGCWLKKYNRDGHIWIKSPFREDEGNIGKWMFFHLCTLFSSQV